MRHLLAAFVGAIVVFMWGFTAWAAADIWSFAFAKTTDEVAVHDTIRTQFPQDGAYFIPRMPKPSECDQSTPEGKAQWDAFEKRLKDGPTALVLVRRDGLAPIEVKELVRGFGIEFGASLLFACILSAVAGGFVRRVFLGFTVAAFMATATWGVSWNFFHLPNGFALAEWFDTVIGWTLCAAVLAFILPKSKRATA